MKMIAGLLLAGLAGTASAAANDVCAALYGRTELDPVRGKIAMNPPATFAQLTDTSKATDQDQVAIVEYDKARIGCFNAVVKDVADLPDLVDAFTKAIYEEQEARASLFTGKSTFGEYNTASQRIMRWLEAKADELARRDAAARDTSGAQGAAIARGASAGARQALPVYNAFPKPMICTSTRRGTLVDTYCR
jgi:hypothetical protein